MQKFVEHFLLRLNPCLNLLEVLFLYPFERPAQILSGWFSTFERGRFFEHQQNSILLSKTTEARNSDSLSLLIIPKYQVQHLKHTKEVKTKRTPIRRYPG